jgi:hypothetical protein
MGEASTIGFDIAKSVFQVHGVDVAGAVVIRKRVTRSKVLEYFGEPPPCLVGIEACPSAHHCASNFQFLSMGQKRLCRESSWTRYAVQHRELMPLINYARHKALLYKPQ